VEPLSLKSARLFVRRGSGRTESTATVSGSGQRYLRALMRDGRCCSESCLERDPRRKFFCSGCNKTWSVSHSAGHLLAARSENRVGVDIQSRVHREAALRWLGRATNVDNPSLVHWSAAEASLKALGRAGSRDEVSGLVFPAMFPFGWTSVSHVAKTSAGALETSRGRVLTWSSKDAVFALALF
jgi:hypothetical protein